MKWAEYITLPVVERRKALARDIVAAVKAEKLIASGEYLQVAYIEEEIEEGICAACAIGASYMASVNFNPKEASGRIYHLDFIRDGCEHTMALAGFDLLATRYIEDMFEANTCAPELHREYPLRINRLEALWQMIADSTDGLPLGYISAKGEEK